MAHLKKPRTTRPAGKPRYNTINDIVGPWSITLSYDDGPDVIRLTAHTPGSRWTRSTVVNKSYPVDEVEEALEDLRIYVRTWGATRLF